MFKTDLGGSQKTWSKEGKFKLMISVCQRKEGECEKIFRGKKIACSKVKRWTSWMWHFNGTENNLEIYLACYTGCWL